MPSYHGTYEGLQRQLSNLTTSSRCPSTCTLRRLVAAKVSACGVLVQTCKCCDQCDLGRAHCCINISMSHVTLVPSQKRGSLRKPELHTKRALVGKGQS